MRTIFARKRTMLTAADTIGAAQPRLLGLVKRAEAQTGSRMLAYEGVARRIGATPSWVRKFLGNQPVAEPSYSVVANILAAYRDACQHWDDVAAEEKRRFFELSGVNDGLAEGAPTRADLAGRQEAGRAEEAAGLVFDVVDANRERLTGRGRP